MSKEDVNTMQGKGQNIVDESYFFDDPDVLRDKYIEHMEAVTINLDINNLDIKSAEYLKLEQKYEEKEAEVNNINTRLENIEKRFREIDQRKLSRHEILEKLQ